MKKSTFIRLMKELVRLKKLEEKLNTTLKEVLPDNNWFSFSPYEEIARESIKEAMNDTEDWIAYWLYDLDCGKKAKINSVKINGEPVKIKTLSNLYDLIEKRK